MMQDLLHYYFYYSPSIKRNYWTIKQLSTNTASGSDPQTLLLDMTTDIKNLTIFNIINKYRGDSDTSEPLLYVKKTE